MNPSQEFENIRNIFLENSKKNSGLAKGHSKVTSKKIKGIQQMKTEKSSSLDDNVSLGYVPSSLEEKYNKENIFDKAGEKSISSSKKLIKEEDISYFDTVKDESIAIEKLYNKRNQSGLTKVLKDKDEMKKACVYSQIFERKF